MGFFALNLLFIKTTIAVVKMDCGKSNLEVPVM